MFIRTLQQPQSSGIPISTLLVSRLVMEATLLGMCAGIGGGGQTANKRIIN